MPNRGRGDSGGGWGRSDIDRARSDFAGHSVTALQTANGFAWDVLELIDNSPAAPSHEGFILKFLDILDHHSNSRGQAYPSRTEYKEDFETFARNWSLGDAEMAAGIIIIDGDPNIDLATFLDEALWNELPVFVNIDRRGHLLNHFEDSGA